MSDHHFDMVMVYDRLGTAVRIKPFGTAQVLDPLTDTPISVTQNGQVNASGTVVGDAGGRASFVTQQGYIKMVSGGLVLNLTSPEAASSGASNAAAAQAAQQAAESASAASAGSATESAQFRDDASYYASQAQSAAAAGVAGISSQFDQFKETVPTIDEQPLTARIPGAWVGSTWSKTLAAAQSFSLWVPDFPCKLVSMRLAWESFSLAANDTNYWRVRAQRIDSSKVFHIITTKTTQVTGGEGITNRIGWSMNGGAWDTAEGTFAAGDILAVELAPIGAPAAMALPVTVSGRWVPL